MRIGVAGQAAGVLGADDPAILGGLTRGLRGCAVYFEDEPTRDFVLSRIDWTRR